MYVKSPHSDHKLTDLFEVGSHHLLRHENTGNIISFEFTAEGWRISGIGIGQVSIAVHSEAMIKGGWTYWRKAEPIQKEILEESL